MPKIYRDLTQNEKDEIYRKNQEYINKINAVLENHESRNSLAEQAGDEPMQLLKADSDLEDRLNDQEELAIYNISLEIKERKETQNILFDELEIKFGQSNNQAKFILKNVLKTDGSKYAKEYNEKVYNDFLQNPNKVIVMLYKKVTTFDPSPLVNLGNDKVKLLEYYRDNHEAIDLADSIEEFSKTAVMMDQNEEFTNAFLNELKEPAKVIAYPARLAKTAASLDYFALPHLYKEQAIEIFEHDKTDPIDTSISYKQHIKDCMDETNSLTYMPKEYFEKIKGKAQLDKNFLSTYVATQNNHAVEFNKILDPFSDEETKLSRRNELNSFKIRNVNAEYLKIFNKVWGKDLNRRLGYRGDYSVARIKDDHKGGFFERWILRSTSTEYKNMISRFEEYNNEASPNYLNDNELKVSALEYLRHKNVSTLADLENLKGTSLIRCKLAFAILNTINNKKQNEENADKELENGYPIKKELLLNENDLEINTNNNIIDNEIVNNLEMDNEIKMD